MGGTLVQASSDPSTSRWAGPRVPIIPAQDEGDRKVTKVCGSNLAHRNKADSDRGLPASHCGLHLPMHRAMYLSHMCGSTTHTHICIYTHKRNTLIKQKLSILRF